MTLNMEKKTRIIIFWLLIIAGFLIHSLTDALPAFWGDSIVVEQGPAPVGKMVFMVIFIYLIPVIGILLMAYGRSKMTKVINAVLACIMGVFGICHMAELIGGTNPAQFPVMPTMAVIGVLLAIDSVIICKE